MKKVLWIGLIALSVGLGGTGCKPKPEYGLKIYNETHDFGVKAEGIEFEVDFILKNIGRQMIRVENVHPTCNCIKVRDWDKEIPPGKKGRIPVFFQTHGYRGEVIRFVDVTTNLPENDGLLHLEIKGNVGDPVDISPKTIPLGNVGPNSNPLNGSCSILNNTGAPLEIKEVILPNEQTRHSLEVIRENMEYKLNFSVSPPFKGSGLVEHQIILKTNYKKQPECKLNFSYYVMPPVQVYPSRIVYAREKMTKIPFDWLINIYSSITEPIGIKDISIEGTDRISYRLIETEPGIYYKILVTIPGDFKFPANDVKLNFRVENDPGDTLYEIPIVPFVPREK